jgi:hypothetical protein
MEKETELKSRLSTNEVNEAKAATPVRQRHECRENWASQEQTLSC